jgi:hypothetical protein
MQSIPFRALTLGNVLRGLAILGLVLMVVGYVHFQARNFIQGPAISLDGEYSPVQHERRLTLHGNAENIVKLSLNGKEIHTDKEGVFTHELVLENGYTIMSLTAEDRFGRMTSIVREYVYVPPN